jgi:hypothetical protein
MNRNVHLTPEQRYTIYVELLVDEDAARFIRAGQKALVSAVSDTNKPFEAFVKSVIPLIDASRGTVTVQLAITASHVALLPDQTVSAQIIVRSFPETLSAPQRFFRNDNGRMFAFSKNGNKAVLREVHAEALGSSFLRIDSGLTEGDTILFAPALKNNAIITIKKN